MWFLQSKPFILSLLPSREGGVGEGRERGREGGREGRREGGRKGGEREEGRREGGRVEVYSRKCHDLPLSIIVTDFFTDIADNTLGNSSSDLYINI